ncbi:MAG: hypothetical protein RR296_08540 [Clostridia bacterium]
MMAELRLAWGLLTHPGRTVARPDFAQGKLRAWVACQAPMLAVLVATGLMDPAEGFGQDARTALAYLGGAVVIAAFAMGMSVVKSFLVCWAAGVRDTLLGATRRLLPLHCLLALLDAAALGVLFFLRGAMGAGAYLAVEQVYLFGMELLFALGAAYILYERMQTPRVRAVLIGVGYFLAASAWHLLSVLFG